MSVSETSSAGNKVQVGDLAPNFTLPDQTGKMVSLKDLVGQKAIVLYFYPKDNTAGCTTEACSFRDSYEVFKDAGAEVIGVSSDSVESHQQFARQHRLPFVLLSDVDGKVRKRYGASAAFGLMPGRVTYIIDQQGVVRRVFSAMFAAEKHIVEALNTLKALQ